MRESVFPEKGFLLTFSMNDLAIPRDCPKNLLNMEPKGQYPGNIPPPTLSLIWFVLIGYQKGRKPERP